MVLLSPKSTFLIFWSSMYMSSRTALNSGSLTIILFVFASCANGTFWLPHISTRSLRNFCGYCANLFWAYVAGCVGATVGSTILAHSSSNPVSYMILGAINGRFVSSTASVVVIAHAAFWANGCHWGPDERLKFMIGVPLVKADSLAFIECNPVTLNL